jgi:hypothetical protein
MEAEFFMLSLWQSGVVRDFSGVKVFFVCGAPKSGTTWLQRILDAHPQVCCSGEGHFITRFSSPVSKVVNTYNADLSVEAQQVYEGRPDYAPVTQVEFDDVVRVFVLRRLSARAEGCTQWVGDKTPTYTRHLDQLHRLFPEAKVFHIVRDPRDVAVSRMGHQRRVGRFDGVSGSDPDLTIDNAIRLWKEAVTAVDAFAGAHPGVVHEVCYHDLQTDPRGAMGPLFRFLGATSDAATIEPIAEATSFEAMAGRPRGQEDPDSFLRKGVSGDWKTSLDAETAQRIADNCGELMREKRFVA